MGKAIFTTKVNPGYNDLPELMYHFSKTYLRQAKAAVGDWIVYYEPRREDMSPGGRAGRQCYFATARVTHIEEDPSKKDHYYAFVENYLEFSSPVSFKSGSVYLENGLKKADGSTNKGAFGRAVRAISDEEYRAIIEAGLSKIDSEMVREEEGALADFDVTRPIIQQIIERPFREAAFSRVVKEEYGLSCAMTGMSIKNTRGLFEIEAAHIKPVSFNGPDSIRNGIALCRTLHWMFDHGLVSVADNNEIITKKIVPERIQQILNNDGKIRLPAKYISAPHPEFLKFHRDRIFNGTKR